MKLFFTISFLLLFLNSGFSQLKIVQYQLDNGLTIILNPDENQSNISGAVAVNTGSKNDPEDATGISHYLEHLLFKGTEQLGTIDFEAEKIHLDSIYFYYDLLATTTDENERLRIQNKINSHSVEASKYAMPNEFDKLIKSIGATGVNATTNSDLTIYFNSFPSHQISKWLNIYAHRFQNPVFRSFQSELEVVYEEKNRAMDNLQRRIREAFSSEFYKNHPYGENNTLGSIEHLKNPSLTKMYEYFNTYYVANNMALILTGNFSVEEVKPLIAENFGNLKSGAIPSQKIQQPQPFAGRNVVKKRITPIKVAMFGFRTVPSFHEDAAALTVASYLLQNDAGTGLIDELSTENKVMMAFSFHEMRDEAGDHTIIIIPKVLVQSFSKVEKLMNEQLTKLKNGEFSESLLTSVKNEIYKDKQLQIEQPANRLYLLANAYRAKLSWEEVQNEIAKIETISKEDIKRVTNKYFNSDYFVFQSRTGFPKKKKLEKPNFKPLMINQDQNSIYSEKFHKIKEFKPRPKFIDFKNDLEIINLGGASNLYLVENPINNIYELSIKFHTGLLIEPKLEALKTYLELSFPKESSLSAFKNGIGVLGSNLNISVGSNYFELNLTGIEKNLNELLTILNNFMVEPQMNKTQFKTIVNDFKTVRKQEKEDALLIAKAIAQYALFGNSSVLKNRLTFKEIEQLTAADYLALWRTVKSKAVSIHFTGKTSKSELKDMLLSKLNLNYNGESDITVSQSLIQRSNNKVLLLDNNKILQSHVFFVKNSSLFNQSNYAKMNLFNQYFDGGFSGILTQEVREYRSLVYSSTADYDYTFRQQPEAYFYTYIATQADKTNAAIDLTYNLIQDLPKKPERFNDVRENVRLKNQSTYPNFRVLSIRVEQLKMMGFENEPNEQANIEYDKLQFNDIVQFYEQDIQKLPTIIGIHGDAKRFNIETLEKIAPVEKIKRDDVIRF